MREGGRGGQNKRDVGGIGGWIRGRWREREEDGKNRGGG